MAVHELLEGGLIPSPCKLDELVLRSWPAHHCRIYAGQAFEVPGHAPILSKREPPRHRRRNSSMSSRRLAIATALAVLGLAPPAFAKGIEQVEACGAGDCRVSKSIGAAGHSLIPPVSIPEPAPFYRLNVGMGHEGEVFDTIEVLWAPSLGMIAYDEPDAAWVFADAKTRRLAARLTEGLEPFPATKMPVPQATARVDEIVTPGAAAVTTGDGGGPPWAFLAVLAAAGLAGIAALLLIRPARRRGASTAVRRAFRRPSQERG